MKRKEIMNKTGNETTKGYILITYRGIMHFA